MDKSILRNENINWLEVNQNGLKKGITVVVFVLLLGSPLVFKPYSAQSGQQTEDLQQVLDQYGFYLKNVASQANITFEHHAPHLDAKINHIMPQIASMGASVTVCDVDKDGWNDLYFTNSRKGSFNALYHNNHDGTFTDIAPTVGLADMNHDRDGVSMGAIWGDYDNDGFEDLFLYKWGKPELFRNIGGTSFQRVTDETGLPDWINANTAIWVDVDNDGLLDLFIGAYYKASINLWDLDNTRIMPESYEYANNGGRNYLFHNQGNGTFEDVTTAYGLVSTKWTLAAGAMDINGDSYPELIVANDYSIDEIYENIDGKKFIEVSKQAGIGFAPKSGMNVSFGDINNNGGLSIFISNITEMGILMQGNNLWTPELKGQKLTFRNAAQIEGVEFGGWCYGAQFGDLNNDGYLDLYVANGYISARKGVSYWYDYAKVSGGNKAIISDADNWPPMDGKSQSGYQQNKIWLNLGGVFEDVSLKACQEIRRDSRAVALVDLWNRGALDIVVANQNSSPLVLKNRVDTTNHWIAFNLIGTTSNRSAIGAKIDLYWQGQHQIQGLTGGTGFSSQNQHTIHYGLGKTATVEKAIVIWPDGKQQIILHPEPDRVYTITETD